MAEDYWHAGRRFLVSSLLLLFSVCANAQRTSSSSSGKFFTRRFLITIIISVIRDGIFVAFKIAEICAKTSPLNIVKMR